MRDPKNGLLYLGKSDSRRDEGDVAGSSLMSSGEGNAARIASSFDAMLGIANA
jgi:hypothetical protein